MFLSDACYDGLIGLAVVRVHETKGMVHILKLRG